MSSVLNSESDITEICERVWDSWRGDVGDDPSPNDINRFYKMLQGEISEYLRDVKRRYMEQATTRRERRAVEAVFRKVRLNIEASVKRIAKARLAAERGPDTVEEEAEEYFATLVAGISANE